MIFVLFAQDPLIPVLRLMLLKSPQKKEVRFTYISFGVWGFCVLSSLSENLSWWCHSAYPKMSYRRCDMSKYLIGEWLFAQNVLRKFLEKKYFYVIP